MRTNCLRQDRLRAYTIRVGIALSFLLLPGASYLHAAIAVVETPFQLETLGARAEDPSLAVDGGGLVGCAWVVKKEDRYRVVFRERSGDVWSAPAEIGGVAGVTPATPQLLYDSLSQPHLIWSEIDTSGNCRLMHASRQMGAWILHGVIDTASASRIADPTAAIDSQGKLHVAWRQGDGSFWRLKSATVETSGTATLRPVPQGKASLQLYPVLIARPIVRLFWFAEDNGAFSLQSRFLNVDQSEWKEAADPDISSMPLNRLPLLFGSEGGATCGVWVDSDSGMERIFWGISGPETHGAGVLVDEVETVPGSQPVGTWSPEGPVVAWRGEPPEGPMILVRKYGLDGWNTPARIPAPFSGQPRVASTRDTVYVCWISDAAEGGDGNLYVTAVRWTNE